MDRPDVDPADLRESLSYIRKVNTRLGGVEALLRHLRRWSVNWPRDRAITLLDVGTGSGDLPVAARAWGDRAGFDLRITGVDLHEGTLAAARDFVGDREGIELVHADATKLMDLYEPASFDYVHAGLFLHHLSELRLMTVLRIMDRLAARGIVWNDLVRTRIGYAAIHVLTLGKPEIIRHDARVSVRAGFTKGEVLDLASRVGIDYAGYRSSLLTHRFTLAGERPGCWR